MSEYKRCKKAETVLALCFTESRETYHHWRVFSHGSDGVRIKFDRDGILSAFGADGSIIMRNVNYKKMDDLLKSKCIEVDDAPFLKRLPYQAEREFGVVYVDSKNHLSYKDYPIQINSIQKITLSPWLSKSLEESVKKTLRLIDGCSRLPIVKSTILENEDWKSMATRMCSA